MYVYVLGTRHNVLISAQNWYTPTSLGRVLGNRWFRQACLRGLLPECDDDQSGYECYVKLTVYYHQYRWNRYVELKGHCDIELEGHMWRCMYFLSLQVVAVKGSVDYEII